MEIKPNFLFAWVFLTLVFALHVLDEALNDFLSLYNPLVSAINEELDVAFFPVFSFANWLTGLIIGIMILLGFSFFARQPKRWIIYLGYIYGMIMLVNGIGHILGSLYYSEWIAGVYTSPLLVIGSVYLLWSAGRTMRSKTDR